MKPYLALDIETTGLNLQSSELLQVAAVWDDGSQSVSDLRTLNLLVDRKAFVYAEPYAMWMNGPILKRIALGEGTNIDIARGLFLSFLNSCNNGKLVVAAGKNAAGFDLPILRANGFDVSLIKHRVIDVGSLYLTEFGTPPSLDQINEKTGRPKVSHDALSDCFDVVAAIRNKFGFGKIQLKAG